MQRRDFLKMAGAVPAVNVLAAQMPGVTPATKTAAPAAPGAASPKTFVSGRADGRFVETSGFVHAQLRALRPRLEYRPGMSKAEFTTWQRKVREKIRELMCFPDVPPQPEPKRISTQTRKGYRLERWEAYPEPYAVVPFLMLVPDGVSAQSPAPAVMCFPGSFGSKEALAGEPEPGATTTATDAKWLDNRMAWHYAQRGQIALAFDSPATNELADELDGRRPFSREETGRKREIFSLYPIWMGRSLEGISVFQKAGVLQWLARQPFVDPKRIATSGHSLGAKPADILGILYPDLVAAVVHNDFVCNWQERAVALNLYAPGSHQILPGVFQWFDYTDLQAALAPKPLLITEGGRANQIAKIRNAYELWNAPGAMQVFYYDKFADPASRRFDRAEMPVGITMEEYFEYAYVDVPMHQFHPQHAVPWLAKQFGV
jgi:dienelactone hydrolase